MSKKEFETTNNHSCSFQQKKDMLVFKVKKIVKMYDNTNKYFKRLYLLYGTINEMTL